MWMILLGKTLIGFPIGMVQSWGVAILEYAPEQYKSFILVVNVFMSQILI